MSLSHLALTFFTVLASIGASQVRADDNWVDITSPLMERIEGEGLETAWPGGCSGVVVNRLSGDLTIKVVGLGMWRSSDLGANWSRIDEDAISGRDETGYATNADANDQYRIASFSLDGTAGWTTNGAHWTRFADLGRNWDYGSIDWGTAPPQTIIAAKHETDPPGEVYVTTDGGQSWMQLDVHLQQDRGDVSMVGALGPETLIYGNGDGIYRSTDTGATWTKVSDANPQTRIPVLFDGAHYLGTADGLLVSHDLGGTWQQQGTPVNIWQGPYFGAGRHAMVVVGDDGIFRTFDSGTTWTKVADLKPDADGFQFTPNWFGCYAWDPINNLLYASSMGNPVYQLKLASAAPFPDLPGAVPVTFKKVGDVELRLQFFRPEGWSVNDQRPAVVFYFGGGWKGGNPAHFAAQAEYLASQGMVACCAEYRITSVHGSTAAQSVADAKSAIRFLRSHAGELGIDPDRIVAGGGSAGGHLAAAVATLPGLDEEGEDLSTSCVPNALVLFDAAVDITADGLARDHNGEAHQEMLTRIGATEEELSPTSHVTEGLPPTIMFHGKADSVVPYAQVEVFAERMTAAGNQCELVGYDGKEHNFYASSNPDLESYHDTLRRTHLFLKDLGWLTSDPAVPEDE
jgi:acetyl esterase/lipase/photosystem II stability/assembly factor-like uncharacterized protein